MTIEYDNPSPVDHSVAIEMGSKTLAESETSRRPPRRNRRPQAGRVRLLLHRARAPEAGMEGTLTVE